MPIKTVPSVPTEHTPGKLCLRCAYRKLKGWPEKPCATCLLLNVDPLAHVRANAARTMPLSPLAFAAVCLGVGVITKPARCTPGRG